MGHSCRRRVKADLQRRLKTNPSSDSGSSRAGEAGAEGGRLRGDPTAAPSRADGVARLMVTE
jgi:hypothetical protein